MKKSTLETPPPILEATDNSGLDFEYRLLKGHNRTDGSYKTSQQLRMEYLTLTDRLIEEIQEGTHWKNPETGKIEVRPFDNIIFLDKSARPVAWLMKELWPRLATDEDGHPTPMPQINFLNIDRKQWVDQMDVNGSELLEVDHLDPHVLNGLRAIFAPHREKQIVHEKINDAKHRGIRLHPDEFVDELSAHQTALDGKNILIVDEVRSTGRTRDIAIKLLKAAFPTATVHGTFWMSSQTARLTPRAGGIAYGNGDLPVWYREDTMYGRGVGDRQLESRVKPRSLTQKLGRYFLSSRLPTAQDPLTLTLRRELHELASNPDVPVRPSPLRDDYDERLQTLNPGKTIEEIESEIDAILDQRQK